ncbi:MAG: hypothetical protein NVV62_15385 [Terricaulis sp.]|nr:hypothetical protein [Terricaulis sp.]
MGNEKGAAQPDRADCRPGRRGGANRQQTDQPQARMRACEDFRRGAFCVRTVED